MSGKPILAVLHKESSAFHVINNTNAGIAYPLDPDNVQQLTTDFPALFHRYSMILKTFTPQQVRQEEFANYTAYAVTGKLAALLDKAA